VQQTEANARRDMLEPARNLRGARLRVGIGRIARFSDRTEPLQTHRRGAAPAVGAEPHCGIHCQRGFCCAEERVVARGVAARPLADGPLREGWLLELLAEARESRASAASSGASSEAGACPACAARRARFVAAISATCTVMDSWKASFFARSASSLHPGPPKLPLLLAPVNLPLPVDIVPVLALQKVSLQPA